jgi:hydrogenase maturation protein HypF
MIRIVGIGSPFGDDSAGLEAARRLAAAPPPGCEVVIADRPGAGLIDLLAGADSTILIDAVRSGGTPGAIHDIDLSELDRLDGAFVSSHDLGVGPALKLAAMLGRAPACGRILGIEAGAPCENFAELSEPVQLALDGVEERAREWVRRLAGGEPVRESLRVIGTVQGVGFRPFVWRLARRFSLAGWVRNTPEGVEIEVEGTPKHVDGFRAALRSELPPAAHIAEITVAPRAARGGGDFVVIASERGRAATVIPPDLAMCDECAREIADAADRRFRYPFTNCTACGPRFTVVRALPYDRARTTLDSFALCGDCAREYANPADRRFRAEPIACPRCGPRAWLEDGGAPDRTKRWGAGSHPGADALARAGTLLAAGAVLAVQGIGGVHLACDAAAEGAVARLRAIKRRAHKPLAVMVASLDAVRALAILSPAETALLESPAAPIVIVRRRDDAPLAAGIAPGNDHVGIMLAYSPLHRILLADAGRPLVMTSANRPGEPLARTADQARAMFGAELDALLLHDRPIHQRADDGVWMATARGPAPVRLGRGSVPRAITVALEARQPILAVGGDIKNAFCLLAGRSAMMSQYVGALENAATRDHFFDALEKWIELTAIRPTLAAHDLHPLTAGRAIAQRLGLPAVAVQHHHAHVAACLAENRHRGAAIGIALDGTGYGTDGAIWGGEALVADLSEFRRVAHLEYLPLPGGDAAVRNPLRVAAGYQLAQFGEIRDARIARALGAERVEVLRTMLARRINTVATSSMGRLFDAVAAILGVRDEVTYEGQAAIELEALARQAAADRASYPAPLRDGVIRVGELLDAILSDAQAAVPPPAVARRFHNTVVAMIHAMASLARDESGLEMVALSGGCFQNRLLLEGAVDELERDRFTVLVHREVPAGDGGLALGQAVVAAARSAAGLEE